MNDAVGLGRSVLTVKIVCLQELKDQPFEEPIASWRKDMLPFPSPLPNIYKFLNDTESTHKGINGTLQIMHLNSSDIATVESISVYKGKYMCNFTNSIGVDMATSALGTVLNTIYSN